MLFLAYVLALVSWVLGTFCGFTDDQLVPIVPFVWPENQPLEDTVRNLENYLEKHVSIAQDSLTPLEVHIDKTARCQQRSLENATFLVLCRNDELYALLETVQSINDRYNYQFCHDWVFLNDEPFDEFFMIGVALALSGGNISFGQVPSDQWGSPPWIDHDVVAKNEQALLAKNVYKADNTSYKNMCRYFLGFFYKHPLLSPYKYYWRLEPGVRYYCDIKYDVFKFMREGDKKYGFTISLFEYSDTITSLWKISKQYFSKVTLPDNNMVGFVENADGTYNLCHFWLNFEIADLDFFRSSQYQSYFDHLDQLGGFFYERWGDAPIHTLAATHLLKKDEIWWFQDIGYLHSPFLQCPQGKAYLDQNCACNPDADFTNSDLSCVPFFREVQNT